MNLRGPTLGAGSAARIGDVGLQVVRDWVLRLNARGPAGLIDGKAADYEWNSGIFLLHRPVEVAAPMGHIEGFSLWSISGSS